MLLVLLVPEMRGAQGARSLLNIISKVLEGLSLRLPHDAHA